MPKRNILKQYGEHELYHVYNRGVAKMDIFREREDYEFMLGLFDKYLSSENMRDSERRVLPAYGEAVELVAFCLMPNHYHLLLYLKQRDGIMAFMRSAMTSYSMYFNKKYGRVGGLFESRFLASRISSEEYWQHISRYIHLNPIDLGVDYLNYPYSSIGCYVSNKQLHWLHPERVYEGSAEAYTQFLSEYESVHDLYKQVKHELAHE